LSGTTEKTGALEILDTYQGVLGLIWDGKEDLLVPPLGGSEHHQVISDSRFLSQSLFLYGQARDQGRDLSILVSQNEADGGGEEASADDGGSSSSNGDVGVGIISISGARKLSSGYNQPRLELEILYQSVGTLMSSVDPPKVKVASARPIRWPGDSYTQPPDYVPPVHEKRKGGGGLSAYFGGGDGDDLWWWNDQVRSIMFIILFVIVHPLWDWMVKALHRKKPPPCVGAGTAKPSVRALPDNTDTRDHNISMIEQELRKLTDRQMDVLRAVEVDVSNIQIKGLIGTGSFSQVYKVSSSGVSNTGILMMMVVVAVVVIVLFVLTSSVSSLSSSSNRATSRIPRWQSKSSR